MHKIASRIVHRNLETIPSCIDTSTEDEEINVVPQWVMLYQRLTSWRQNNVCELFENN